MVRPSTAQFSSDRGVGGHTAHLVQYGAATNYGGTAAASAQVEAGRTERRCTQEDKSRSSIILRRLRLLLRLRSLSHTHPTGRASLSRRLSLTHTTGRAPLSRRLSLSHIITVVLLSADNTHPPPTTLIPLRRAHFIPPPQNLPRNASRIESIGFPSARLITAQWTPLSPVPRRSARHRTRQITPVRRDVEHRDRWALDVPGRT